MPLMSSVVPKPVQYSKFRVFKAVWAKPLRVANEVQELRSRYSKAVKLVQSKEAREVSPLM